MTMCYLFRISFICFDGKKNCFTAFDKSTSCKNAIGLFVPLKNNFFFTNNKYAINILHTQRGLLVKKYLLF